MKQIWRDHDVMYVIGCIDSWRGGPIEMRAEENTDKLVGIPAQTFFVEIGEDGWQSPDQPPLTDRVVQVAWSDMSTSATTLGFYDGVAENPDSGRRFWWTHPRSRMCVQGEIGAWRDIP